MCTSTTSNSATTHGRCCVNRARSREDPGRQRLGDDESSAAFVITLDAINFGSGYFPYLRKREGMSGYHTVAGALRDRVTEHGPISARWLREVDVSTCNAIFDQPDTEFAQELMGLFAGALRDLGEFISGFDDSFVAFVRSAGHSAAHIVDQLDRMPYFHDVATYRGLQVPIYKRAQITAFDLAQAFADRDLGRFDDLHRLTMFADNLVPHVLRVDGVLRFSDELVARIERVDDIVSGSSARDRDPRGWSARGGVVATRRHRAGRVDDVR